MPELPEVETQRKGLVSLVGKKIVGVEKIEKRVWKGKESEVVGKKITNVLRRGKFLLFELDGKIEMVVHFRMTGHFLIGKKFEAEKCVRAVFKLSGGESLVYQDIRMFGKIWTGKKAMTQSGVEKLGPEPIDADFTVQDFLKRIERRKGVIKVLLLNQSFVAGVGNIYADEALFLSKIHPLRRAEGLSLAEKKRLYEALRTVLNGGIKNGGTTVGEYVGVDNERGRNQEVLKVYSRAGKECLVCGTKLRRIVVGQRGTVFCPRCQKED